ncbi:MAG: DUF3276 family protein [Saprospirales bacterium]|nr:MAG: DUF3276 family protein [Saprospirales bacterium]
MEKDNYNKESVYSRKVRAGKKRTYFFDVKQTKGDDFYITLTESTRRFDGNGYNRHKIFLYKEDFNRFVENLEDVVNHIKNDLMPNYDYNEFADRYDDEGNYIPQDDDENKASDSDESIDKEDMSW